MPRFRDAELDYTFFIKIHPVIKMHFRQRGWTCLFKIADFCGVHIEDLCRACDIDTGKDELDFHRDNFAIWAKLGLSADDILRMIDYEPPSLNLIRVLKCKS